MQSCFCVKDINKKVYRRKGLYNIFINKDIPDNTSLCYSKSEILHLQIEELGSKIDKLGLDILQTKNEIDNIINLY